MEKDRTEQFLREGVDLCTSVRRSLQRLEHEPFNRDFVHQAFRFVHSLKSEAQLVGLEEIGAVAHEMEGVLDQIRRNTLAVDGDSLGLLFPMVEALEEMLREASASGAETDGGAAPARGERYAAIGSEPGTVRPTGSSVPHFGDFERQLIQEARGRGEALFRMTCEIEDSAPLKYPKAYLVVNNLEVSTNVILTIPSFETTDDEMFRVFDVYYTASVPESEIRKSVDVDQIKSVEIREVTFEELEAAGEVAPENNPSVVTHRSSSSVRVENGRLDEIMLRLRSVRSSLERLKTSVAQASDLGGVPEDLDAVTAGIGSLARLVADARKVTFAEELRQIPWLVQDLAGKLGKRIRLSIQGGPVTADRRLISMLSDPLVHLVRNAVDHGIESPEERTAGGKGPEGSVVISAVQRGDELLLQVGDDGRGISETAALSRASELGFDSSEDHLAATVGAEAGDRLPVRSGGLLGLLVRPGFSTRTEPTAVSGRGVGLDAIYQKVHQQLGGELRLQTQEGKGTLFTIAIPAASTMMSTVVVRCGGDTVAIPLRDVDSIVEATRSALEHSEAGSFRFEGQPLRALASWAAGDGLPDAKVSIIRLRGTGSRTALLCDEILFERDLLEGHLVRSEPNEKGLRSVTIAGVPADFFLLDAAAIE